MRLHTTLDSLTIRHALMQAKRDRLITEDVMFIDGLRPFRSQTHPFAFEAQLGTYDKASLPAGYTDQHGHRLSVRRFKNSGNRGASNEYGCDDGPVWAATWHEWGWFMAYVFKADPTARWGGIKTPAYADAADFHAKTGSIFKEDA